MLLQLVGDVENEGVRSVRLVQKGPEERGAIFSRFQPVASPAQPLPTGDVPGVHWGVAIGGGGGNWRGDWRGELEGGLEGGNWRGKLEGGNWREGNWKWEIELGGCGVNAK